MIYFDNAATTFPKPEQVYTFMDEFYRAYGINAGRGRYNIASKAQSLIEDTRNMLLQMFNCINHQVVFTHSATEALNVILQGLKWQDGFNVYITPFEHNAVTRVLHAISQEKRITLHQLTVDKETFTYDMEQIKYQFQNNKPHVLIATHASNVTGLITPIQELCKLAKDHDALTILDTAQTAGLLEINLSKVDADYTVFAGHKTLYGPLGVGGFIQKKDLTLKPLIYGGTGIDSANLDMPKEIPKRFEAGSTNIHTIAGLSAALKWINEIKINNLHKKEIENTNKLIKILENYYNVKVIGRSDTSQHIGVVSCVFDNYTSNEIGQVLNNHNIAVRTGLHCSPYAHRFLDTYPSGTVRFSVSYFNANKDFNNLVNVLDVIEDS